MPFNVNAPVILAAIVIGMALIYHALGKRGMAAGPIFLFMAMAWASGLLLGKLFFLANDWLSYGSRFNGFSEWLARATSADALTFALYGYSSAGGIAGAILGAWLFSRRSKISFVQLLDDCAAPVLLMYGVVRVGCALYGCCYGIALSEPDSPFMKAFLVHAGGRFLFPVQWLDFAVTMALCLFIHFRSRRARHPAPRLRLALLLYPVQRILLEFLRGDEGRGMIGIFSTTQILFLLIWATGIVLFRYLDKKNCSISQEQSR